MGMDSGQRHYDLTLTTGVHSVHETNEEQRGPYSELIKSMRAACPRMLTEHEPTAGVSPCRTRSLPLPRVLFTSVGTTGRTNLTNG
jgi:hypothetical protein